MKQNLVGILVLWVMTSVGAWAQQPFSYIIKGVLEDTSNDGKMIYIERYDDGKLLDSTKVEADRFVFSGKVDTASFCRIDVSQKEFANFILENGEIRVNLKKYNQPSGTIQNNEIAKLSIEEDSLYAFMGKKREECQKQYPDQKEFAKHWELFTNDCRKKWANRCVELYKEHNDDAVGFYLLYSVFMNAVELETKEAVIHRFGSWLKSRNRVKKLLSKIEAEKKTAEGLPFADIKGKREGGISISLSDYIGKGNYVLMDMWASWCGPCKGEIPNLAKLHDKYKDKGLTVLGLFVWDEEKNLKKAVEGEKITWPQIIDSENTAMQKYGVDGIPHIILFAPDGTILKRNLRGEEMIQAIEDIMNKK